MGRLHSIILLTPDLERQKAFYALMLGLGLATATPGWVWLGLRGGGVARRAAPAGAPAELQIAITAVPLESRVEALKARGVAFEGEIEDAPACRLAVLRDPDGNRVQLVEPKGPESEGKWPRLSHAIVNSARFATAAHFYRDVLGLRVAEEHDGWVEFETGPTRLAIHDREDSDTLPLHAEQKIAFAFEDEDFDTWAEELRERGIKFAAAPMEEDLGVQAEVEDADGWFVVLHGPPPEEPREEELAEDYVDDDEPQQRTQMIRKPGETTGESTKKRQTAAKIARQTSERAATKSFETPRTREPETGGFGGGGGRPDRGGFTPGGPSGPRPGGFGGGPRPSGPGGPSGPRPGGFSGPRPGGPGGPSGPRTGGSSGPSRPGGPSGPGGSGGPRPGGFGSGPRPGGPGGPSGPRPGGSGPRPGGPGGPSGPRPGPRPGGPPRGGSGGSGSGSSGRE